MKPEDLLSDDFLKQFKTGQQLNDFLGQIQKRTIEKMLEGELDGHLGYGKNEQSKNKNARNGYGKRKIKTQYGESEIQVPSDRDASFNPMIVPKRERMAYWMTVLTNMRARGMEDILIRATDNLNGFTQTIRTVFPHSATQICVVYQIRNSCRYVVWKDKREFSHDMRDIYGAPTR